MKSTKTYKITVLGFPKTIGIEVDRVTHDNQQLQNKTSELMSHLCTKPRFEPLSHTSHSLKSASIKTKTSKASSSSSSSSKLRRKAQEAKAAEEAKRAELRMLALQEEQEEELAALRMQQELQLAKKQREITRTKLQSQIAAEQVRREVLEQAAREEDITATNLMRPPTSKAPSVVSMNAIEQNLYDKIIQILLMNLLDHRKLEKF